MNPIPSKTAALVGALGYVAFLLFAPVSLGLGSGILSLWMLPLIAIHLWPRGANVQVSLVLILILGGLADFALGQPLGLNALIALIWFFCVRPDSRDQDVTEGEIMAVFALGCVLTVLGVGLLTGQWGAWRAMALDAVVALAVFPIGYRLLRMARLVFREPGREAFP